MGPRSIDPEPVVGTKEENTEGIGPLVVKDYKPKDKLDEWREVRVTIIESERHHHMPEDRSERDWKRGDTSV